VTATFTLGQNQADSYLQTQIHDSDHSQRYTLETFYEDLHGVQRQRADVCNGGYEYTTCVVSIPQCRNILYQDVYVLIEYAYIPYSNYRYVVEYTYLDDNGIVFPVSTVCFNGVPCYYPSYSYLNFYHHYWGNTGNNHRIYFDSNPNNPNPYSMEGLWIISARSVTNSVTVGVGLLTQEGNTFYGAVSLNGSGRLVVCGPNTSVPGGEIIPLNGTTNGNNVSFTYGENGAIIYFNGTLFANGTASGTWSTPYSACLEGDSGIWTAQRQ